LRILRIYKSTLTIANSYKRKWLYVFYLIYDQLFKFIYVNKSTGIYYLIPIFKRIFKRIYLDILFIANNL